MSGGAAAPGPGRSAMEEGGSDQLCQLMCLAKMNLWGFG